MSEQIEMTADEMLVYERWLTSPHYWFKDCVITIDEARSELGLDPVRRWPHEEDYLKYLLHYSDKYPVLMVNKSRRMMATWIFSIRLLYKILFFQGQANFIICKKFDDAFGIMKDRIISVYENIPEQITVNMEVNGENREITVNPKAMMPKITIHKKEGRLTVDDNKSYIQASVAGHNPLRGKSASNVFFDEAAAQPMIRET